MGNFKIIKLRYNKKNFSEKKKNEKQQKIEEHKWDWHRNRKTPKKWDELPNRIKEKQKTIS